MGFWKKLLWYLVGVGLGVLAVMFIFGDRDLQCSYFPNDRVLYDLRKKTLLIPEEVQQQMDESGIDTSDIALMMLSGNVDFEKSNTQKDGCKTYHIDYEAEGSQSFSTEIKNCDSTATLLQVSLAGKP